MLTALTMIYTETKAIVISQVCLGVLFSADTTPSAFR